jgi:SnoaL-like protein
MSMSPSEKPSAGHPRARKARPSRAALLEVLLAKQELSQLLAAYSRAADRADERALASLFHPGAISDSGVIRAPGDQFARLFVSWVHENAAAVAHCVCSSWFDVRGGQAIGESYVLAFCRLNASRGGEQSLTAGRYLDRFARIDGVWKFAERRFVIDGVLTSPTPASALPVSEPSSASCSTPLWGRLAPDDPICAFWRQASGVERPDGYPENA